MKWSEHAWQSVGEIYEAILEMPFIGELAEGNLPRGKFQFYMTQDSLYLEHFGRALAFIGAKAYHTEEALAYIQFAANAIVVENALHKSYFKDFGIAEKGIPQPACHHYIHFLKSTAAFDSVETGMAATLPCFWIYKKVGDFIYNRHRSAGNPYQRWIETYAGEDFGVAVQNAIDICDRAAENATAAARQKMTEAFVTASRLEYDFWDAAYHQTVWK